MTLIRLLLPVLGLPLVSAIGNTYKDWTAQVNSLYGGNCYSDLVGIRTLWGRATNVDSSHLTVEVCLDACEAQGYSIAGVEYSQECWCGNSIQGDNFVLPLSSCNMRCTGDSSEYCGGSAAMNLWARNGYAITHGPASILPAYGGYSLTVCWDDYYANNRVLAHRPSHPPPANNMTVAGCINACAANGYSSAGVEYASECYCDNKDYPIGQSDGSYCDMPCSGDATEICGGPNRMLVYLNPTLTSTTTSAAPTSTSTTSTASSTATASCAPTLTGSGVLYGDFECGGVAPWSLQISAPAIIHGSVTSPGLTGNSAVEVSWPNPSTSDAAISIVQLVSPSVPVVPLTAYKLVWAQLVLPGGSTTGRLTASVNGVEISTTTPTQYHPGYWVFSQAAWTAQSYDASASAVLGWFGGLGGRVDTVVLSPISAWCGPGAPPLGLLLDGEFECGLGAWTQQLPDPKCTAGVASNAAASGGKTGTKAWAVTCATAPMDQDTDMSVVARILSSAMPVEPGSTYMLAFTTYFTEYGLGFVGVMINGAALYTRDPGDTGQNGPTVFSPNTVFWTAPPGVTTAVVRLEAIIGEAGTMMVDGVIFTKVNDAWAGAWGQ